MKASDRLVSEGYEDVVIFENPSYDDALIGVSDDNRAIYDYDKMIAWLCKNDGMELDEAVEFIEFNTIRAIPYYEGAPIIMYSV
jgi:hypothetical protein